MAPTASPDSTGALAQKGTPKSTPIGPHPSYIEVAKPYILQSSIQKCLIQLAMSEAKEDAARLQGVAYIDQVRRTLQLPVRTFNTAVVYYHKFRLLHAESEYGWADAAAAALFVSCKIEDTLKKSREILAGWWNLKVSPGEQVSSDDPRFESHSKLILGLERLMLESAGFDFRSRHPQKLVVKLARAMGWDKQNASKTAWNLCIDLYRTFAPLKQTTPTMAIACLELAARLHDMDISGVVDNGKCRYKKWNTSRAEVMETLLDLLDLFNNYRGSTSVGPAYSLETFINIRITLNQEASAANIPRYATYASDSANASPNSPANHTNGNSKIRNGIEPTSTPRTPATPSGHISPGTSAVPPTSAIGVRGQSGTVRFMLSAQRAREEAEVVDKYWKDEEEEYEEEVVVTESVSGLDRGRDSVGARERDGPQDWEKERRRDSSIAHNPPTVSVGLNTARREKTPAKSTRKKGRRGTAKLSLSPWGDRAPPRTGQKEGLRRGTNRKIRNDYRSSPGSAREIPHGYDARAHDGYGSPQTLLFLERECACSRDYYKDYYGGDVQDSQRFGFATPQLYCEHSPSPLQPNRIPLPNEKENQFFPRSHVDRRDDRMFAHKPRHMRELDFYIPHQELQDRPLDRSFPPYFIYEGHRQETEAKREFRETRELSFCSTSPLGQEEMRPAQSRGRGDDAYCNYYHDQQYREHSQDVGSRPRIPDCEPHSPLSQLKYTQRPIKEKVRPAKARGKRRNTDDRHDPQYESPQDKVSQRHQRGSYSRTHPYDSRAHKSSSDYDRLIASEKESRPSTRVKVKGCGRRTYVPEHTNPPTLSPQELSREDKRRR